MWDGLDLAQKQRWISFFVRNGITDRQRMKSEYEAMYLKKMEDVAQKNYANWGYDSPEKALVHALNDNTYDYNKWFADNPGSTENSDTHWRDDYKTVYHPTFSDESMYSGVVDRNYNPEGRVGGYWDQDGEFVPASWQGDVEYKKGGSINIKHPGRLTELKKRTGKTEAELYNDGNPAHKKMVVFARNARQWNHKHQLGGNVDNWMSWWYKNRTPQLVSNFDEYYNVGSSGYEPIADRVYEANLLVGDALNDVAGIGVHKAPLAGDLNGYLSENVYGGEPKIVLGYDERPDIELHEKTHYLNHLLGDCYNEDGRSYFNSPFQMAIGDVTTGDLFEDENGRYQHDEYLDNQDEIYSRLNQIRYRNGLDPKKKYTEKEIEDMRRKGMLTLPNGDGLERYTNKFIQHLLNDVAYNNAYDSNTSHYAANGGHLFQGTKDSTIQTPKLTFQGGKPYLTNNIGTFLPETHVVDDAPDWISTEPLQENPRNTQGLSESNGIYYFNGVPTGEAPLQKDALTGLVEFGPAALAGGAGALAVRALTNPFVDAGLTVHGAITAPGNIKEGIQNVKDKKYLSAGLNFGMTALDLFGAGNLFGRTARMLRPSYRAKHAYNSISPLGYSDPIKKGKNWFMDMWNNAEIDFKNPKWYKDLQRKREGDFLEDGYTSTGRYIDESVQNRGIIGDQARIDAWALHNGLPQQYGTYIKNADGSYSYDLKRINDLTNGTFSPLIGDNSGIRYKQGDFVTGAGGGLQDWKLIAQNKDGTKGITYIEDLWDVNPFSRITGDLLGQRLAKRTNKLVGPIVNARNELARKINNKLTVVGVDRKAADKFYNSLDDIGWEFAPPISEFVKNEKLFNMIPRDEFGNARLFKHRYFRNNFDRLSKMFENFEVGKITGGKPFLMKTEIPWKLDENGVPRLFFGDTSDVVKLEQGIPGKHDFGNLYKIEKNGMMLNGGHIFDGPDESQAVTVPPERKPMKTIGQKVGQKLVSQIFNPNGNIGDAIGWAADVAGVPSSVTNAARDVWNRAHNSPVILANAAYNLLSEKERGNDDYSWAQALMDADTNPGWFARAMLTYPLTNTASNYTDEELANMHQADLWSEGTDKYGNPIVEGQIVHDAYRTYNGGDYAKNVNMKVQSDNPEEGEKELSFLRTLSNPMKAVEWSLGQTSGIDIDGQRTTFDRFAFDIDDTLETYNNPTTLGMKLRKAMGRIGSLGYPGHKDSATSIVTKVPVSKQIEAYDKFVKQNGNVWEGMLEKRRQREKEQAEKERQEQSAGSNNTQKKKKKKEFGGHLFQYAGEMYTPRTDENGFLNYAYPMTLQYGNDTAQDTVVEPVFLEGMQEQMQDNADQTYGFRNGMTIQDIPTIDSVIGDTMYGNVHDSDRTMPVHSYGNEKLDERKNARFETFVDDNGVIQTVDRFANYRMLPDDAFGELQRNANSIKNTQDRDRIMSEYDSLPKGVYSENTMMLQKELLDNGFYDDIIENKVGALGRSGRSKIRDTQRMLLENGYYENGTDSDVYGVFGDRSKSAYRKYLADNVVDGIAGNDTKQAIYRYYDANAERNQNTLHDVKAYAKQCARYVREFAQNNGIDTWGSGVYGDAWTMFGNINDRGGDVYYNIYDKSFNDVKTPGQLRKKTEQALKDNKIDYSMLKQGDIVGIYIPSSGAMQSAIDEGYTKNTHVGIVDHIENGMPVIRHNINGKARLDKADKLTGSTWGKAQIAVAARPKSSTINRGGLPELKWNDNAKSDMVYEFEHPEQVSEKRKDMVSEYMDGLAGAKDNMEMLFPNVDMDVIEKAAIGILRREGNFMETEEGNAIQNVSNFARGIMKSDEDRTVRTSGLKLSSFTERERNMLGIKSRKDLDGSLKKQARGVMYILSKNYDYMKRYAQRHPELGMTDDEILGFALIGFNQGMGKLYAINPESIEEFRRTSFNNEYKFPISYNEKPVGQVFGSLARRTENVQLIGSINRFINDKAMEEYDSMGYGRSYKPYAIDVFDSMQNVVPRDLAQNQMGNGGGIIWDNMGQWNNPGKVTGITGTADGTDITMKGVADYLYGIDNYGNGEILVPGQDYHFPGDKVVEYPITSHKHQFGGLLGESNFGNMAALAQLQGARAGLPMDFDVVAPFLTQGNVQQSYYPYETQYVPKVSNGNEKKDYGKFKRDKKKFVEESFDNWYDTFAGHGHSHDDSVRMAKFFALQDAYESGYGNKMSVENNNFGGMNDVKEARRQGVHFVPVKYNTKKDYYEAKYNDIVRKWSGALLPETVTIEDFYNALHANPAYQYAPKDVNPNYLNSLLGMKSAQKWIDEYSANYGRGFQEGGLAKPFSYKQLPVVRFDKGGHAYIAK